MQKAFPYNDDDELMGVQQHYVIQGVSKKTESIEITHDNLMVRI